MENVIPTPHKTPAWRTLMGMRRHTATALIALTLLAACTPAKGRDTATALAAGEKIFDAVRLPSGWTMTGHRAELDHDSGVLVWNRDYQAAASTEKAVLQALSGNLTRDGWHANDSCMGPRGEKCFIYEKDGYTIHPSATDIPCLDGSPGCVRIVLSMDHL